MDISLEIPIKDKDIEKVIYALSNIHKFERVVKKGCQKYLRLGKYMGSKSFDLELITPSGLGTYTVFWGMMIETSKISKKLYKGFLSLIFLIPDSCIKIYNLSSSLKLSMITKLDAYAVFAPGEVRKNTWRSDKSDAVFVRKDDCFVDLIGYESATVSKEALEYMLMDLRS